MTITNRPSRLSSCPDWCDVDHAEQQRELDALANFPEDRKPFHDFVICDCSSYRVAVEQTGREIRLFVTGEANTLTADQADALASALVLGARLLRSAK